MTNIGGGWVGGQKKLADNEIMAICNLSFRNQTGEWIDRGRGQKKLENNGDM